MSIYMFSTWSRERTVTWIEHIEMSLAGGAVSITNPDTGTVSYDFRQAERILIKLKTHLARLDGVTPPSRPRINTIRPRIHPDC